MRVLDKLIIKLYSIYNFLIYPRLRHIRGATRLKSLLRKIGEVGYEGVDENSVQLVKDLEWDNLIILDSCRYDIYSEIREAENIEKRLSGGSSTVEFIKNNFSEPYDSDLVYVTAVYNHIDPGRFRKLTGKKMDEVFAGVYDSSNYGWNEDYLTTTPEGVLKAALEASEEYPGAKKIIHFR